MDTLKHNKVLVDAFELAWEGRQYEICVSLPARYASGSQAYPVLFVLDGNLMFGAASDAARMVSLQRAMVPEGADIALSVPPETIVVGVGYPASDAHSIIKEFGFRRMFDFTQLNENLGPEGERLRKPLRQFYPEGVPYGGAPSFLRMLTTDLKAQLASRYRVDPKQAILYGASAGGMFAAYALLEATPEFTHYIIASPCLYLCGDDLFEREAAYAEEHEDMQASVFLSFGSRELDLFAQSTIASSTTRFAERLRMRNYPGLNIQTAILQDETHARACLAALPRGLDVLFGAA